MKRLVLTKVAVILLALALIIIGAASGLAEPIVAEELQENCLWAAEVVDSSCDGCSSSYSSLGSYDEKYFSLGEDGWIILDRGREVVGSTLTVYDYQYNGDYKTDEWVLVHLSLDGLEWWFLGEHGNWSVQRINFGCCWYAYEFDLDGQPLFRYVKLIDTTNDYYSYGNGVDVDAVSVCRVAPDDDTTPPEISVSDRPWYALAAEPQDGRDYG